MSMFKKQFLSEALAIFKGMVDNDECSKQDIEYWSGVSGYELNRRGASVGKKRWYTKDEASDYIGVSRSTFDRIVSGGGVPKGKKMAGKKKLYWKGEELDDYKRMALLMRKH